ncbi:hypothetical protein LZK98_07385 [Sphingomonas cannabina]|uniref:hypothetical protein n=1 Tax=Sphingomonas cannabina TaxID=2899123 RepID=UPI001F426A2E|nr:hypothetical protein [Sphingomonas cannabina]UIJ46757.1 hypothetical protein LZK98_07385 [Sphingomonas cannabina]
MSEAGARLSPDRIVAILAVGVIGVLIPGLQPQLLGALEAEGVLGATALGVLATVELLAMGLAAGGAGFVLPSARLREIAGVALIVTGALDLMTPMLGTGAIFPARIAAGLAEGVLVWIAIGFIVRSRRPERWAGIYLAVQTLAQFALATLIGLVGASAGRGFTLLGAVTIAGLLALPWLPRAYAAHDEAVGGRPPPRGLVALGGVLLYLAFIVAIWVYIEPLARQRQVGPGAIAMAPPLALAMQVLGAAAATLLAGRVPARLTLILVGAVNLGLIGLIGAPPSDAAFVAAVAAFGFLWLFVMPFQIPIVIAADPSRRAAMLIGGAQLTGSSLGPFLAALLVSDADVSPVLWFGGACAAMGVAALIGAGRASVPVQES